MVFKDMSLGSVMYWWVYKWLLAGLFAVHREGGRGRREAKGGRETDRDRERNLENCFEQSLGRQLGPTI